ncbi:hypothetical protein GOP47_0007841 [Adiantum capillus-veneris]|uniref:Pentatricopeptide repeat-containing protein n=1 Tax=Adiantum capillus-veneris TaxID=13818 RepID=A0A9D4V2D5_ADICA|nr:hypothetical protein GOP47_0007841 [Adiantum capillus-veneris]
MLCGAAQCHGLESLCTASDIYIKKNTACWPEEKLKCHEVQAGQDKENIELCVENKMKSHELNPFSDESLLSSEGKEPHAQDDVICEVSLVGSLKTCAKRKDLLKGNEIHKLIVEKGLLQNSAFIGSALISMYAKCGALDKAQEVFDSLALQNAVLWNSLIAGYVQHGHSEIAINSYEQMQRRGPFPNAVTFVCALKACGNIGALDKGQEIHGQILQDQSLGNNTLVANSLIDMYAKCGALNKAEEVLDKLIFQDVISWTALIAGFVQHEYSEKALDYFDQMQSAGFTPDAITFSCALKASGSLGALDKGQSIHAQILKERLLETNVVVTNSVITMYAKCGALDKAREVFNGLLNPNTISWNALISGYAQHGHEEEALSCFKSMKGGGFFPDAVTFTCILKVCGALGALGLGDKIHTQILREHLIDKDIVIGNALVDMYAKCGKLEKAQEVFDQLPTRNVASWNALITGYAQHGHCEQAVQCFRKMQVGGLHPNAITLTCILKGCLSEGDLKMGEEIHAQVLKEHLLVKDMLLANGIIEMYGKCGFIEKAREVFNELSDRNAASWTALIVGYSQHGRHEEALDCFKQMQVGGFLLDAVTVSCIFQACGSLGALDEGRKMHAQIVKEGVLEQDIVVANALMDMYAKCDSVEEAQVVFDKLHDWDTVSWNVLMAGYAQQGDAMAALECFEQMQAAGGSPDAVTFACILKACGTIGALQQGQEVHLQVLKQHELDNDIVLASALVTMYAQCGALHEAQKVFDELSSWNIVSWTALINGYAQHGLVQEALSCFEQMHQQGLSPNAVTLACLFRACGSVGAANKGQKLHAQLVGHDSLETDIDVKVAIVGMYAKCGMLAQAHEVFKRLQVRDVVSWTTLLGGYSQLGKDGEVLRLFDEMLGEGVEPDSVTFTVVLNTCSHRGLLNEGQIYFEMMSKHHEIIPTEQHHTCVIDLFSRAGHLDNAVAIMEKMSCSISLITLENFLGACQKWGDKNLGRWAFEHALQLDGMDSGTFVYMRNIFAASAKQGAGRLEAMESSRSCVGG